MRNCEPAALFEYYNERLERLGIGEHVETVVQLSQMDRISAAVAGVGIPVLGLWLLGRCRMKAAMSRAMRC